MVPPLGTLIPSISARFASKSRPQTHIMRGETALKCLT